MSEHHIEDLVEESVRLVIASNRNPEDKRRWVGALYRFQERYDTSRTFGRLADELDAIGFDVDAPRPGLDILDVVAAAMKDADEADNRQLVHHWLGVLAEGMEDYSIDDADVPASFDDFRLTPAAAVIREIAMRHEVHKFRSRSTYVSLPTWIRVRETFRELDPSTLERRHSLRFLLDHRADTDAIAAGYVKEKTKIERFSESALFDLPAMVPERGDFRYLAAARDGSEHIFVFEAGPPQTDPEAARLHLVLKHNMELGMIAAVFGVRSGLIERWQGHRLGPGDTEMHFSRHFAHVVPEAALTEDKTYDLFGGWKYRMDQSAKVLAQRLDAILAAWSRIDPSVIKFHAAPLSDAFDKLGLAGVEKKQFKWAEKYGYFFADIDVLYAAACHTWDRGENPSAIVDDIRARLAHVHPMNRWRRGWVETLPGIAKGPVFPPSVSQLPYRRREETYPLDASEDDC